MANELAQMTVSPDDATMGAEADLATASASPAPAAAAGGELPSPIADVVAGAVPGFALPPIEGGQPSPVQAFVVEQFQALQDLGLDYLELPDLTSVVFNPDVISEEDLQAAADAGTLPQIAPFATELGQPVAAPAPAGASEAGPLATATVTPAGAGNAPVRTDKRLETARIKNVTPPKPATPNPVVGQLAKRAI